MATDPALERREGALTANRIAELAENPIQGKFDEDHLKAVHAVKQRRTLTPAGFQK